MIYPGMSSTLLFLTVNLVLVRTIPIVSSGRILLYPYGHGYTSRLVDMRTMAWILQEHSHQIAFLINDVDQEYLLDLFPDVVYHLFPTPENRVPLMQNKEMKSDFISSGNASTTSANNMVELFKKHETMCDTLLSRPGILSELRDMKYDVIILDVADNCGCIVSEALNIPAMPYSSTGMLIGQAFFPNLPSFVPNMLSSYTSDMNFWQRLNNMITSFIIGKILTYYYFTAFERLEEKHGLHTTRKVDFQKAYAHQLNLVHSDFALDEPRPMLPNVILIGGMFVLAVKPVEKELDEWMNGAGDAGVVIVSFGSLIKQIDDEKATIIATSLAKLKQRVIWRLDATYPPRVGTNTRLLKWLPQNDLLAHPQTKLFVTHCGIHSTYETATHGVPVVAVPLMLDQHMNAVKLTRRAEMGVLVDFQTLTNDSFLTAIVEVLEDPKYTRNAKETSRRLRDHPQTPQEVFLFWVDYVIRNKGIGKMALEPLKHLGTFELYCIDVILFMFVVVLMSFFVLLCSLRLCYRWICARGINRMKSKTS